MKVLWQNIENFVKGMGQYKNGYTCDITIVTDKRGKFVVDIYTKNPKGKMERLSKEFTTLRKAQLWCENENFKDMFEELRGD